MKQPKVYVKFPKTGLGNMMLVWARGLVFARLNNLDYVTSSWWGFRWGALLRQERKKRLYIGYFKESSFLHRCRMNLFIFLKLARYNPPVKEIDESDNSGKIFVFDQVITGDDLFADIRPYQDIVAAEISHILIPHTKKLLSKYQSPVIGIHIRRGDFKLGNATTSIEHFRKGINLIRAAAGFTLPVSVFTDAEPHELQDLLDLQEIQVVDEKPDILDILLLSKSKVLMLSRSSTFSYWAAFLSNALVIKPQDDWQRVIKFPDKDSLYREVDWSSEDSGSTEKLKAILLETKGELFDQPVTRVNSEL